MCVDTRRRRTRVDAEGKDAASHLGVALEALPQLVRLVGVVVHQRKVAARHLREGLPALRDVGRHIFIEALRGTETLARPRRRRRGGAVSRRRHRGDRVEVPFHAAARTIQIVAPFAAQSSFMRPSSSTVGAPGFSRNTWDTP